MSVGQCCMSNTGYLTRLNTSDLVPVYDVNFFGLLILSERNICFFVSTCLQTKIEIVWFQTTSNLWYSFIINIILHVIITNRIVPIIIIHVTQIVWGHVPDACCQINALPIP